MASKIKLASKHAICKVLHSSHDLLDEGPEDNKENSSLVFLTGSIKRDLVTEMQPNLNRTDFTDMVAPTGVDPVT